MDVEDPHLLFGVRAVVGLSPIGAGGSVPSSFTSRPQVSVKSSSGGKPARSARRDALVQRCVARVKDSRDVLIAARRSGAVGAALEMIVANEVSDHSSLTLLSHSHSTTSSYTGGTITGDADDDDGLLTEDERIELLIELERIMIEEETIARWEEMNEDEEAQFQSTVLRFDSEK
jgi:hypothetical protein